LPICNIQLKAKNPSLLTLPDENDQTLGAELKRRRLTLERTQEETARRRYYIIFEWDFEKKQTQERRRQGSQERILHHMQIGIQ
jgi:hypothetical protein